MKKFISLILILSSLSIFSQQEAANWYFGQNAGLRFNQATNQVTAVTNGQLNTLEGCTSFSDSNGDLLFYSDGRNVWNRAHNIMLNGTGLKGDESSTSSGLIVPKPQDSNFYYIFTVDEPHHNNTSNSIGQPDGDGINDGLMYSLIDMSLDGGLGGIVTTEKNVPLTTYNPNDQLQSEYKCSEKITAVKADDCYSFWVITHFIDKFFAFKVDTIGVDPVPVVSTVGPSVPIEGYRRNALGYIKASPDGTKLAVAHFGFSTTTAQDAEGGVYLFDFDNDTGVVSNTVELYGENYDPSNIYNDPFSSPYGIEFSPENKKVYATIGLGFGGNGSSQILQWDLESNDIRASKTIIHQSNTSAGALQLGIDKRIYRAQMNFANFPNTGKYLGIIENPDDDANNVVFNENGILVDVNNNSQNLSRIGLPPFIQSLFNTEIDIIQNGVSTINLDLCTNETYTLMAEDIVGADYTWTFNDVLLPESDFDLDVTQNGHYEVIVEPNNGDCPIEGEAYVSYFEYPIASQPSDLITCDDNNDGVSSFNFISQDADVLGTQDNTQYSVHYYESLIDAQNDENEIIGDYENISNPQQIFVRVKNVDLSRCADTNSFSSFNLEVFNSPVANTIQDVELCDDAVDGNYANGQVITNLLQFNNSILNGQNNPNYSITYHSSLIDAENGASALPFNYYNSNAFTETVYVRIQNDLNPLCFDTTEFVININPRPDALNASLFQCDEDGLSDGFTLFNLTEANEDLTGGSSNLSTKFYLSFTDAENSLEEIDGNAFNNFLNPQTIYVQVIDDTTGCFNISELTLEVSATNANDASLTICDDDGTEDGFNTFNLSDAEATVLNGLPNNLDVQFFESYEDALLEVNPLNTDFTNSIAYSQIIYVRVENENACYGINEIQLTVFELPNIETEFQTIYCLNTFPETITLSSGIINDSPDNYLFDWDTGEDTNQIEVNESGTFNVTVSNVNNCSKTRTITVLPSNIASINNIEVTDASQNNTITVLLSGEGDYEFALDDINGPYFDDNFFENVSAGIHTVFVRDKNDCGITEELVSVIGFPRFFTPNNDGYNDTWQIKGVNAQFQPNTLIYIYDRYGKLISQIDPTGRGWNGILNGRPLPNDDYWFAITLEDGRIFKDHFSLKR